MKRIITVIVAVFGFTQAVLADTCGVGLTGVFTAAQATKLCSSFLANFNQDLIPDTDDTYDLGSSADKWKDLYLSGNAVVGGTLAVTGASTLTGAVGAGAITSTGAITSSITTSIGWSVVAGANTACNTTCTSGCVVGQDTGTANVFVACDSATADVCLCAGAS